LPEDVLTGFGLLPNNYVANRAVRAIGRSEFSANESDILKQFGSDALRQDLEKLVGELYSLKPVSDASPKQSAK
jgi:hypothetical protein